MKLLDLIFHCCIFMHGTGVAVILGGGRTLLMPRPVKLNSRDFKRAVGYLIRNHDRSISLEELADSTGLAKVSLNRLFKSTCSLTPMQWIWNYRVHLAKTVITHKPDLELRHVASVCGFSNQAHFSKRFVDQIGARPAAFRAKIRSVQTSRKVVAADVKTPLSQRQLNKFKKAALSSFQTNLTPGSH
ncbi:MAG: helix-turn-helix transcriptional regulator [Deltaproteobacteria bacterium]|nr:helix-turn-helix transcriptional regulator [Deltaproteobacteria bacterium]